MRGLNKLNIKKTEENKYIFLKLRKKILPKLNLLN